MSGYKEFEGKTLDDAIRGACSFYDVSRDKLEVEICNDAKGGIFGLMGVKKARIRAKLVELANVLDDLDASVTSGKRQKKRPAEKQGSEEGKRREENKPRQMKCEDAAAQRQAAAKDRADHQKKQALNVYNGNVGTGVESVAELFAKASKDPVEPSPQKDGRGRDRGRKGKAEREKGDSRQVEGLPENGNSNGNGDLDHDAEDLNWVPFDQLDQAELESVAREIVTRLTEPFLGGTTIAVTTGNDRVRVCITDVEDPGLLIGRDGQNLASLQYLVTRMLSSRMKALLRVQIDAGDYRERQDERLRDLAFSLAEKVKAGGRPQVTRPLSSYHRRVIHLALQEDPLIQTHSKGEGEMKRVMIAKKKQV